MNLAHLKLVKKLPHRFVILLVALFALGAGADIGSKCSELFKRDDYDKFASSVAKNWEEIQDDYKWRVWVDSPAEYQRFVNLPDLTAAGSVVHPTEVYRNALKQYRSLKLANDHLNAIPRGRFKPTIELFQEVHQIAMKDVYTLREKIAIGATGGMLNMVGPGKFKRVMNFGFSPLTRAPLTDAELLAVRADGIVKFWSFFRGGADRNYGLLVFPGSPEMELKKLLSWYEESKATLSPIQLAAGFQRRFIQIHPFDNGNGRVSRLFMDRILAESGLPPALLRNQELDLYMSEAQWAQEVAAGVAQFEVVARKAITDAKGTKTMNSAPFVGEYDHGAWISAANLTHPKLNIELFPGKGKTRITVGNAENEGFILYRDGFFYSESGIPYVFRNGELYPVSDQNYLLYGFGANLGDASTTTKSGFRRTLTSQMEEVYAGNLEAVERISAGTLDPKTVKVHPYSLVAEANNNGTYAFHAWEKPWLRRALEIKETSPAAVLAANRGGFTEFEQAFNAGENVRISSILGQYQAVDLNYARLERYFKKVAPDPALAAITEESRKKLWEAVRYYVVRFETEAAAYAEKALPEITDAAERTRLIKEIPQFKLFYDYLPYTRAGYATWDGALKEIPWDEIYLLRNDFKSVRWVGFLPEAKFAQLVEAIPGAGAFRKFVQKRLSELPSNVDIRNASKDAAAAGADSKFSVNTVKFTKLYRALEEKIFRSPYTTRGVDEQYQREYVDLYLHSVDQGRKTGVSFTTRTDQMVQNNGNLSFQGVTGAKYQTYIVRLPVERSMNNVASGWSRQYEVVVKGYSNPIRTVKTLEGADYTPKADPKLLEKLQPFAEGKQLIRIE